MRPPKYPFPWTDCQTCLIPGVDLSDLWCQTVSGSNPPFFHNALDRPTHVYRSTERPRESLTTIGRLVTRATRPNNVALFYVLCVAGEYCRMLSFFPSQQDVEDDEAIDYVILGEWVLSSSAVYRVGQKVSPYWSINKWLHTQEKHCYFACIPTQERQHLISSCLRFYC